MKSLRVQVAKEEIREINDTFHSGSLFGDSFYKQLAQAGFIYRGCVIVSCFPDGGETYFGHIIRQDGRVYEFDVDLGFPEHSTWKEVTDGSGKTYQQLRNTKPWRNEVVAFDLFRELARPDTPIS